MKLFLWVDLDVGDIHGDGIAVVIAKDEKRAVQLLEDFEGIEPYYKFAVPARQMMPSTVIELSDIVVERVVVTYCGCGC